MSLKHFHLIFLFFAILMDGGIWLWTRLRPEEAAKMGMTGMGTAAGWVSLILITYACWYLFKKSRRIIIG